jgi:nucleotide-binding universal stress UspA family protein
MNTNATPAGVLQKLLVATDGTESGDRAAAYAIALAKRFGSTLVICSAVDQALAAAECSAANGGLDFLELMQAQTDSAKAIVAKAQGRAHEAGVAATTAVLDGRPADAIVACANERAADAVIIGTLGKRGLERFFLGSTAEGVLRHTDLPVFVVPPGAHEISADFHRLLVAIDDSDQCVAAAALAHDLAKAAHGDLIFCSVAATNNVSAMAATYGYDPTPIATDLRSNAAALATAYADRARHDRIEYETLVAEGDPAEELLKTADATQASLIVIGTHGRRGLRRFVVGSVAEAVVRDSRVPVAVVRTAPVRVDERVETHAGKVAASTAL